MIKLFNQFINELKASTYIKSGEKLKSYKHTDRGNKLIDYGSKKASEESDGYIEYVNIKDGSIHSVNLKDITVKIKMGNYDRFLYVKDNNFLILKLRDDKVKITKLFDRRSAVKLRNFLYDHYIYISKETHKIKLNDLYKDNFKISEELNLSTYQRAGEKLKNKGHEERGNELIKYKMDKTPDNEISFYDYKNNIKTVSTKDLTIERDWSGVIIKYKNYIIVKFDSDTKDRLFSRLPDRKSALVLWRLLKEYGIYNYGKSKIISINKLYNQEPLKNK